MNDNQYDIACAEISFYIYRYLSIDHIFMGKKEFYEYSQRRWAAFEILSEIYEENYNLPSHLIDRYKPDVFEIIDTFISKMDEFLSMCDVREFYTAKEEALKIKNYLESKKIF